MSRYTSIDLSKLPAPEIIETLDVTAIFERKKAALITAMPDLAPVLALQSEPLTMYLQRDAYDELMLRARINDSAKSTMLAFATGSGLAHLAAFYGVVRQELTPADPNAVPPALAVMENDDDLRLRVQLALEAQTSAGTIGSYEFYARSAASNVKDAAVSESDPGTVRVTILSRLTDGTADATLIETVLAALNVEDVRPLSDTVDVESAVIVPYQVAGTLTFLGGPNPAATMESAQIAVTAYVEAQHRIGYDVTISGLHAALHQVGVHNVQLTSPATDIVVDALSAAYCTGITLIDGGLDV